MDRGVAAMNQFEAIEIRKSVRRYSKNAVPKVLIDQILNCAGKIPAVFPEKTCEIRIYSALEAERKIKGAFRVKAPYYLAVFCGKSSTALIEAGCFAQRLVLYMTTKGLGTCYQGGSKLKAGEIPADKQLAAIIAFGYAEGQSFRDSRQIKRNPLNQMCSYHETVGEDMRTLLKTARLAPSAMNRQPWRFEVWQDRIAVYVVEDAILKNMLAAGQLFDIGIVLCHLLEAADELWMDVGITREEELADKDGRMAEKKSSFKASGKLSLADQLARMAGQRQRYVLTVKKK